MGVVNTLSEAAPAAPARLGERSPDAGSASAPRIGPNAVLQTLAAVEERLGPEKRRALVRTARLPPRWPDGMIPEAWFVSLVAVLREALPAADAEAVLEDAGRRTAAYVAAHRIPAPVRMALRWLPRRVAVPWLLAAFRHHAWTFAGAGRFETRGSHPATLVLHDAPTCRASAPDAQAPRASGGRRTGAYYAGAFEGLLQLAAPGARVRETTCRSRGDDACRFTIALV